MISHIYIIYAMQAVVSKQIEAYVAFPPRQKPASFNLDALLRKLQEANSSANHYPPRSHRTRRGSVGHPKSLLAGSIEAVMHRRSRDREGRTHDHLSLGKDAPCARPIERFGI